MDLSTGSKALCKGLHSITSVTRQTSGWEGRTSSKLATGTTPFMPTFVIVPRAGMQARVANAEHCAASLLVGSSRGVPS